jgi:hypothetical protein
MGKSTRWDSPNQTLHVFTPNAPTPPSSPAKALFDNYTHFEQSTGVHALALATVNMLGTPYTNTLRISNRGGFVHSGWRTYNIGRQYTTLTGTIGRIDGTGTRANKITIIGDGQTLATFNIDGDTQPTNVSVNISGVLALRIQIDDTASGAGVAFTNVMIR